MSVGHRMGEATRAVVDEPRTGSPPDTGRAIRLAVIVTDLRTGGAETFLEKLLPRLPRQIQLHVLSLRSQGEIGPRLQAAGVPVEAFGLSGPRSLVAFMRLVRRLRQLDPHVAQTFLYHGDLIGGLAARIASVGVVAWNIRNAGSAWHTMRWPTRAVIRACALLSGRIPDRIVCCSETAAGHHVRAGYCADRIVVLPNGVDLSRFAPDPTARRWACEALDVRPDTPLLGHFGRLDPQKDQAGFLAAFARVRRSFPDAVAIMVGAGLESTSDFASRVAELGVPASAVRFLGRRDDVARLMAACDVVVSSSIAEAFPNVVAEAMSCGVPCVATDVGESARIVGSTGRIVPPGDPESLARACLETLALPAPERHALGLLGRQRIAETYDIDAVALRYAEFYEALMPSGGTDGTLVSTGPASAQQQA